MRSFETNTAGSAVVAFCRAALSAARPNFASAELSKPIALTMALFILASAPSLSTENTEASPAGEIVGSAPGAASLMSCQASLACAVAMAARVSLFGVALSGADDAEGADVDGAGVDGAGGASFDWART